MYNKQYRQREYAEVIRVSSATRILHTCLRCFFVLLLLYSAQLAKAQFAGGNGSEHSPYHIATPEHLAQMHNHLDSGHSFILINDLDLHRFDAGDGMGWLPIGNEDGKSFIGKFNGNGKTIRNLMVNRPNMQQVGLFGYLKSAEVSNLTLENVNVAGMEDAGSLVGLMVQGSKVHNCHAVSGIVAGGVSLGGLVGYMRTGAQVKNSSANVVVRGLRDYTGGLVGEMYASTVENSTSKGTIYSATCNTGGLVGFMSAMSRVRNSYSASHVVNIPDTILYRDNRYTGGLIGQIFDKSTVENCYASGNVNGSVSVGGLVGWIDQEAHSHNNVALNHTVTGVSDVHATQGRLEGSDAAQQYTRSDMVLRRNGLPQSNLSTLETGYNIHFDSTQIPFYQGISWAFGVDEENPWVFHEDNNMPILWFEGTPAQSLSLSDGLLTLYPDQVHELLTATVAPGNARLKLVQWRSINPEVASVDAQGVIKAMSLGLTTIVARTIDGGHETSCRINVIPRPLAVGVDGSTVNVSVYPNPVSDVLHVEASEKILNIKIYSATGSLLLEKNGIESRTTSLDVANLPKGMNVLVLRARSGHSSVKFVVLQ